MGIFKKIKSHTGNIGRLGLREGAQTAGGAGIIRSGGMYANALEVLGGGNNETAAMRVATAYRCVRLLSESVANLPVLYQKRVGSVFTPDYGAELHYLLNVQPDTVLSGFDFWRQLVTNLLLDGNAYVVPMYDGIDPDTPYRLALCGRNTVSHDTLNDIYTVTDAANGICGTWHESEIIHVKGYTINDPKVGISVLSYARMTLAVAEAGDRETLNRFRNGGNVHGLVSNGPIVQGFGEYQDSELQATAESIDGLFRSGARIVSLPGQVDFKQISLTSADMQFLESRKFTVREVCRFFGVHPSFVFDDTSNNYKSAEQANVGFLSNTLNPLLRNIEAEFGRKLIRRSRYGRRRIVFDRRGLYACDLVSKISYQTQTIAAGIYSINDWRIEEGHQPVEGGDRLLVSANLRGLDEINTSSKSKPEQDKNKINNNGEETDE